MRYFCSVFSLLFILSCVTLALCQNLTSPQADVMKKLSNFTSSWNNNNNVDPCGWVGVGCSDDSVAILNLSGLGFKGNIWKTVCELPSLESLDVSNNSLSTPSSEEIIGCTNLSYLNVSSNMLSGTLTLLSSLKKLQSLDLSHNILEGNIDVQLENLTELRLLYLAYNKFTGSIPSVIGGQKLEELDVSRNKLVGEILQGLVKYTNLTSLDLSSNWLSGTIPENIDSLLKLKSLVLSANKFSGSIPKTLGKKKKVSAGLLVGVAVAGAIFALGAVALSMLACKYFKQRQCKIRGKAWAGLAGVSIGGAILSIGLVAFSILTWPRQHR